MTEQNPSMRQMVTLILPILLAATETDEVHACRPGSIAALDIIAERCHLSRNRAVQGDVPPAKSLPD